MNTDGRINIAINVDGNEVEQARKGVKGLGDDAKGVKPGANQASKGIKEISTSLALVKIGAAAFGILAKSMDAAISRFDTFNTFPNVMSALGESTEDSDRAINRLSDGIDGLPTKLDDIVTTTQRMYSTFKNLDESTDTALALNNALLASGASAGDAQRGSEQYIQSLQKGKFEMEEWKTLQETMTIGLSMIAESFGMTERELKDALDSGVISMDDFNDRMIELGTGTGDLAELAKENSKTIETALTNLRNTASRGLADIIQAFSDMTEEISGRSLYDNLESLKGIVNSAFKAISTTIRNLAPVVILLVTAFQGLVKVVRVLSPLLLGLVSAYTALLTIRKVNSILENNRKALEGLSIVTALLTKEMHGKTIAQLASTKATSADLIAQIASNKTLTAKNIILGLLTRQLSLSTAATLLKAKAVTVLSGVLKVLSGPIGWVVGGIGLLVAGGVALVKWLNRSTEEGEKLAKQTDDLAESTSGLTDEVETNTKEYEKQIRRTEASAKANTDLAQKIEELTSTENLNTKQKKELQETIDQLNGEVEGLNVAYDEEAKALNMSSEEMQKRIALRAEEESYTAAQERQLEITKEQHEVDMQLKDVIALRELYQEQKDNDIITNKEYKDSIAELDEQEKALNDTLEILAVQYNTTEEAMKEAMENQHEVAKTITGEQIILYESLSDSLKQTVDSMKESYLSLQEAATDAFSKIETKTDHTMASMIETLQHNQTAVKEWGQNQAKTIKWAGENGYESLIPYIESMTIDSAAELAVLAGATDAEMTKFAEAMEEGGAVGKDAFLEAHQMSEEDFNKVKHLVTETKTALTTQIEEADFASIGKDITDGLVKGVKVGEVEARTATGEVADAMIEETRNTLQTHSPSKVFMDIGEDITDGLAVGVLMNIRTVTDALGLVVRDMPLVFDNTPGEFRSIGEQIMSGLNGGLNSGSGHVMATARSIANSVASTMRQALDIHSPSRVMEKIGNQVGEGLVIGLSQSQNRIASASTRMANVVTNFTKKATRDANKQIRELEREHLSEVKIMNQRHNEDIQAIRRKAKEDKRSLTKDEQIRIRRMNEDHNAKILDMEEKLKLGRLQIHESMSKEILKLGEEYVERQIWLGQMSAREEAVFWWKMYSSLEHGSSEYETALSNHQKVVAKVRGEMESTHRDYANRVSRIEQDLASETKQLNDTLENESKNIKDTLARDVADIQSNLERSSADVTKRLSDDIKRLNEEYANAHKTRVGELTSFTGLFERYQRKTAVPETGLIRNLQSQVEALADYGEVMADLENKIDNQALIEELHALGPDSLSELQAMNRMNDDQLAEFVGLYEQRFAMANERATKELEPLKRDTEKQIRELNRIANIELSQLQITAQNQIRQMTATAAIELETLNKVTENKLVELNDIAQTELAELEIEWAKKIDDILLKTEHQFDSLQSIGADAIKGLEVGMVSQESSLYATATRIANNITKTIQSALKIKSPSGVMRDMVGRMIPLGIVEGIEAEAVKIDQAMNRLAGNMMITTPEMALGAGRMSVGTSPNSIAGGSGIQNNSSKTYTPTINNYFTRDESTPSEVARENKKQQQRLAMEWGY